MLDEIKEDSSSKILLFIFYKYVFQSMDISITALKTLLSSGHRHDHTLLRQNMLLALHRTPIPLLNTAKAEAKAVPSNGINCPRY